MGKKGYLILENGETYSGISFGSDKEISGEVVFCTGMMGYPESFTDPSYYGQILTMTYPLIGNYGIPSDKSKDKLPLYLESEKPQIRGLVVSSYIPEKSHWQAQDTLSAWLRREGIPALSGIDTRSLTQNLREKGVMKGRIIFSPPAGKRDINTYEDINKINLIPYVSTKEISKFGNGRIKVLFIDCGLKTNQIRMLLRFDTTVIRVPWDFDPFSQRLPFDFDTVFISNGPGDARNMPETIRTVKKAIQTKIPIFGICLGHQILSLAAGGDIFKLKYGHRGHNQPVKDLVTGRCYITSQNHGFATRNDSIPKDFKVWFKNLNDGTVEGIHHDSLPFFSVQFHPEASPGPTDTEWLFGYYIERVNKCLHKNRN